MKCYCNGNAIRAAAGEDIKKVAQALALANFPADWYTIACGDLVPPPAPPRHTNEYNHYSRRASGPHCTIAATGDLLGSSESPWRVFEARIAVTRPLANAIADYLSDLLEREPRFFFSDTDNAVRLIAAFRAAVTC